MFTKLRLSLATTIVSSSLAIACNGVVDPASPTGPSANSAQAEARAALLGQTSSDAGEFSSTCAFGSGGRVTVGLPTPTPGTPPPDAITGGPGGLGGGSRVVNGTPPANPAPGTQLAVGGSVESVAGACPAISLSINGKTVRTNSNTTFAGGSCTAVKQGDQVGAMGTTQADGSVVATCVASGL